MATCNCDVCENQRYPYTNLEAWRKATCFSDPYAFWQWDSMELRKYNPKKTCSTLVRESANSRGCDGNVLGRDDIRQAIMQAEQTYRDYLGFDITPTWHTSHVTNYAWGCMGGAGTISGKIALPFRKLISVGKEVFTEIATVDRQTAGYMISAERGLVNDTFTLTATVPAGTLTSEIKVYVDKAERTDNCTDIKRWEIPTKCVEINGTTATITGSSWLLGKPELYEMTAFHPTPISEFGNDWSLDPQYLPNYLDKLVIMRVTVDQCLSGQAIYKVCGCATCSDGVATCEECENVSWCIDDKAAGIIHPVWDFSALCKGIPESFCVTYQAGDCSRDWTKDIAILSIAYLCSPICACSPQMGCFSQYYQDVSLKESTRLATVGNMDNPIGTRLGHIHAYNLINKFSRKRISTL